MPEHIHLFVSEPAKGTPSTIRQVEATRFAAVAVRNAYAYKTTQNWFQTSDRLLPTFWQPRFCDFKVWSQKKFVEKLRYMHMNRVKRKLVVRPQDEPCSSFSFYAKSDSGLVRIDPMSRSWSRGSPQKPQPSS
jgi:putative transposase